MSSFGHLERVLKEINLALLEGFKNILAGVDVIKNHTNVIEALQKMLQVLVITHFLTNLSTLSLTLLL